MYDNFTNNENLHRYFDGELSGAEALAFELQLKQDSQLQEALQNLHFARYALRYGALKSRVAALHAEMMPQLSLVPEAKHTVVATHNKKWWLIAGTAAAIGLLALFVVPLMRSSSGSASITASELYAANYKAYDAGRVRGDETAVEKAFRQKQYAEVLRLHAALPQPGLNEQFYAACSFLETGDAVKAQGLFAQVLQLNASGKATGFKEDAEYFLAMSLLKQNKVKAALSLFTTIANNPQHLYHDVVTDRLIEQLQQINPVQ
jgi:hypothetical protein